jgi:alcohol dehydrogenase class IV
LVSKKSNNQSVEFALKSLKISTKSFIPFLSEPNMKNATEMSIASNLAGKAINISKTTVPHAVSYPFTSLYNIKNDIDNIITGVNLLRLGNNPVRINDKSILQVISNSDD